MYNLMVTANDGAWEEGAYVWPRSRILEGTEESILEPLKSLSPAALKTLAKRSRSATVAVNSVSNR